MAIGAPVVGTFVEQTVSQNHIDLPYPTTAVGDMLILAVVARSANAITTPAGFTTIASFSGTGSTLIPGLLLAYKSATGSETGNLTVTTPNVVSAGQLYAVSGIDLTNPLNVGASTKDTTSAASTTQIPTLTTGSDGCLLVVLAANNTAANTATPPTGFTETADLVSGTQPIEFCYQSQSIAGATGIETVTWSGSAKNIGVLAAFNPRVLPDFGTITFTANNAIASSPAIANAQATTDVVFTANDAAAGSNRPAPDFGTITFLALDASAMTESTSITVTDVAHTQIVPGVAIRVRAVWQNVAYPLWRGNVDNWGLSYIQPHASIAEVSCTDGTRMLARFNRPAQDPSLGQGEDTGARISRILDSASWPRTDRIIDTGDSTLIATDLSGDAWSEMLTAAASEAGDVYLDTSGRVVFAHRRAMFTGDRYTVPQAVFGDLIVGTTNYENNTSFETGIQNWGAGGTVPPTLAWTQEQAFDGTHSLKVTWGTGGTFPLVASAPPGMTLGNQYTSSRYVYVPSGMPDVFMAVGTVGIGSSTSVKDAWVRITMTYTLSGPNPPSVQIWPVGSPTAGQYFYVDAAQTENGPVATAFVPNTVEAELPVFDIETIYDDDLLYNVIGVTRAATPGQTVTLTVLASGAAGSTTITLQSTAGIPVGAQCNVFFTQRHSNTTVLQVPSSTQIVVQDANLTDFTNRVVNIIYDVPSFGGVRQEARDDASVQRYGTRPFETTGLLLDDDVDANYFAGYIKHLCKVPSVRIASITVRPRRDPARLFPVVLSLAYRDRIRVNFTPPGGGDRISQDGFIRGISHEITPQGFWETKYILQAADRFAFWTIGDPILGRIEHGNSLSF